MSKTIIAGVVVILVGAGAFFVFNKSAEAPSMVNEKAVNTDTIKKTEDDSMMKGGEHMMENGKMMEDGGMGMVQEEVKITFDGNGFNPASVTVKTGTKVTWLNSSNKPSWPASAMHPTHTVYPGSDIKKCSVQDESEKIFDACRGFGKGESYSFVFNEKGSWNYHDHVNAGKFGKVIVE